MGLALLVDSTSIFDFQQYLKNHSYPVQGNINYGTLLGHLAP
jgi:predicted membrane metal-binding protein